MKNRFLPHIIAIIVFFVISLVYFFPQIEGKTLRQSDIQHSRGMSKEIIEYREETGEEPLWTNRMFSGMPAYLISMRQPNNILRYIHMVVTSKELRPAIHVMLYMVGFYLLLVLFGVNPWLSITGALAYGFSTYFIVILVPGHLTKAMALGYMPMIIGAVYFAFRKNAVLGGALTGLFLGLQLVANHLQITYYTFYILLIFTIFELFRIIKENETKKLLKTASFLILGAILAVGVNIVNIWTVMEYSPYTLRGPSELTADDEDRTTGLDKSYATNWSYGVDETFNLLIPNFKGGASDRLIINEDTETFDYLSRTFGPQNAVNLINQNPYLFIQYWGTQPSTAGPVYIGAVVIFFFVFGMFFIKGNVKWWLFIVVVLSLLLAWGKNFMAFTDFFLDYVPGYNKFRTVSMILVMAQLAMPLLGFLALQKLFSGDYVKNEAIKAIKYSTYIVGGLCLLFIVAPGISNLNAPVDEFLTSQGQSGIVSALEEDRANLLRADAFRSLIFVLLPALLIYLWSIKKIKPGIFLIALPVLILSDLWPVNKRYLNEETFVPKHQVRNAFNATSADAQILQDNELYFRVFDQTPADPFASSRSSYFHNDIGGYHGAKIRRYQEIYDAYIKEGNEDILNMLNTKYLIVRDQQANEPVALRRDNPLGNAWFVKDYILVDDADEEISALGTINPEETAVVSKKFESLLKDYSSVDSIQGEIRLLTYAPNKLEYEYSTQTDQLAVFSEIYYPEGWRVSINGEEADYFRVNYILRAMVVPEGSGKIVFEFHPNSYYTGNTIAFVSSIFLVLFLGFGWYDDRKKRTI